MKKDGLWYVHCHLCDVEIMKQDKGKGLFTYKSHLKSTVHKANVFAIMRPANVADKVKPLWLKIWKWPS